MKVRELYCDKRIDRWYGCDCPDWHGQRITRQSTKKDRNERNKRQWRGKEDGFI